MSALLIQPTKFHRLHVPELIPVATAPTTSTKKRGIEEDQNDESLVLMFSTSALPPETDDRPFMSTYELRLEHHRPGTTVPIG